MATMNGALRLRPRGIWLVASLELRQRLRSRGWIIALAVWTVVLLGLGFLVLAPTLYFAGWDHLAGTARVVLSLQMILVLFALLVVVPALSAGTINGDRNAGTLAILQASLLSSAEIVVGKLLAGWLTGLAFLVLALPSTLITAVLAQTSPWYFLRMVAMIALIAACLTALGLGLSSITVRQLSSVVLAYVVVFGVTVMLPVAFGAAATFVSQERQVTVYESQAPPGWTGDDWTSEPEDDTWTCEPLESTQTVLRTDLVLPLLWANPVVMLAETAPSVNLRDTAPADFGDLDALSGMKLLLQYAAAPAHPSHFVSCDPGQEGYPEDLATMPQRPVGWIGVMLWLLVGGGSLAQAIRRLAVPIRRLGRGTRIA